MAVQEVGEEDRTVGGIEAVGAVRAAVVGEAGGDGDAGAGEEECAAGACGGGGGGGYGCEEVVEGENPGTEGGGVGGEDPGRGEGGLVGDAGYSHDFGAQRGEVPVVYWGSWGEGDIVGM